MQDQRDPAASRKSNVSESRTSFDALACAPSYGDGRGALHDLSYTATAGLHHPPAAASHAPFPAAGNSRVPSSAGHDLLRSLQLGARPGGPTSASVVEPPSIEGLRLQDRFACLPSTLFGEAEPAQPPHSAAYESRAPFGEPHHSYLGTKPGAAAADRFFNEQRHQPALQPRQHPTLTDHGDFFRSQQGGYAPSPATAAQHLPEWSRQGWPAQYGQGSDVHGSHVSVPTLASQPHHFHQLPHGGAAGAGLSGRLLSPPNEAAETIGGAGAPKQQSNIMDLLANAAKVRRGLPGSGELGSGHSHAASAFPPGIPIAPRSLFAASNGAAKAFDSPEPQLAATSAAAPFNLQPSSNGAQLVHPGPSGSKGTGFAPPLPPPGFRIPTGAAWPPNQLPDARFPGPQTSQPSRSPLPHSEASSQAFETAPQPPRAPSNAVGTALSAHGQQGGTGWAGTGGVPNTMDPTLQRLFAAATATVAGAKAGAKPETPTPPFGVVPRGAIDASAATAHHGPAQPQHPRPNMPYVPPVPLNFPGMASDHRSAGVATVSQPSSAQSDPLHALLSKADSAPAVPGVPPARAPPPGPPPPIREPPKSAANWNVPLGAAHASTDELLALASQPPFGPDPSPNVRPRRIPKLQLQGARKNPRDPAPANSVPVAPMWHIDRSCLALYRSLCPSAEETAALMASYERVKAVLLDQFPDGSVHLFGSLANGLCITQSNDIDVTLHLNDFRDMDRDVKAELVQALAETLEKEGMREVKPLAGARVPVVKFVMPDVATKIDVTINNFLPLLNTRLIHCYADIDERLKQLIFVVKHWAKRRKINDAYHGTLSSYAYVMLCIFVAQRCGLVAILQEERPYDVDTAVSINDDEWTCRFNADVDRHRRAASQHEISIGGLLTMFFDYFAFRFDFNREVVCPRLGKALLKEDKEWIKKIGSERHLCCIEDPFLLSHDLGRTVDKQTRGTLQQEFERAARIMYQHRDPLPELLKEYTLPKPA